MNLPIIWAPGTRQQYADLLKYIETEFGLEAALKFLEKAEKKIDTISLFPNSSPKSKHFSYFRKAVISKQTSVYYDVRETEIHIMFFKDNRMDWESSL